MIFNYSVKHCEDLPVVLLQLFYFSCSNINRMNDALVIILVSLSVVYDACRSQSKLKYGRGGDVCKLIDRLECLKLPQQGSTYCTF